MHLRSLCHCTINLPKLGSIYCYFPICRVNGELNVGILSNDGPFHFLKKMCKFLDFLKIPCNFDLKVGCWKKCSAKSELCSRESCIFKD